MAGDHPRRTRPRRCRPVPAPGGRRPSWPPRPPRTWPRAKALATGRRASRRANERLRAARRGGGLPAAGVLGAGHGTGDGRRGRGARRRPRLQCPGGPGRDCRPGAGRGRRRDRARAPAVPVRRVRWTIWRSRWPGGWPGPVPRCGRRDRPDQGAPDRRGDQRAGRPRRKLAQDKVLPAAGDKTPAQLRAALRRAVISVDPDAAERRRKDAERRAKIGLYGDEEGTATLSGQNLPGAHAAAAMARISALARAMKSSGAGGGIDLLRAQVYIGLLLGTLPLIPPAEGAPPDHPDDRPPGRPGSGDSRDSDCAGDPGPEDARDPGIPGSEPSDPAQRAQRAQ